MPRNVSITVTFDSSELVDLLETIQAGLRVDQTQTEPLPSFSPSERSEITSIIREAVERGIKAEVRR